MFRTSKQTVQRMIPGKNSAPANSTENVSCGDSNDTSLLATTVQTTTTSAAQSVSMQMVMPISLSSLVVSTPYRSIEIAAARYYEEGIFLATQDKPGQALLSLFQAWSLGLTPLIQVKDLQVLHKLHAALMSLIGCMQKKMPSHGLDLNSFIEKAIFFNNILLQTQQEKVELFQARTRPNNSKQQALISSTTQPTFFAEPKSKNEIINVSGFGNNCGLYALALGIKKLLVANSDNQRLSHIKTLFAQIDELSLTRNTPLTEEIGKKLRQYLFDAISKDKDFQENRRDNFVAYVVTKLVGQEETPLDMLAFSLANEPFFNALAMKSVPSLPDILPSSMNLLDLIRKLEKDCRTIKIRSLHITKLTKQAQQYFARIAVTRESVTGFVKDIWDSLSELPLFEKIVYFRKIFNEVDFAMILDCDAEQGQKNALFKAQMLHLIDSQVVMYLLAIQDDQEKYKQELICYALLADYALDGRIKVVEYEINKTICRYFVEQQLFNQYATIYRNYCVYLCEKSVMLTADELGCLADYFDVKLTIKFSNNRDYQSNARKSLLNIMLCNPTQDHWQVVIPVSTTEEQISLSALINAAIMNDTSNDYDDAATESESMEEDNAMDVALKLSR